MKFPLTRNVIAIIIGVALGLLAMTLVRQYLRQREREVQRVLAQLEPVPIVVAAEDIPEGAVITDEMVELGGAPERFIQPYALTSVQLAIGKVTIAPIAEGEQILGTKLELPGVRGTLASKTPPGMRAVTIEVDKVSGVGGFIRPGDYVDLLWTVAVPAEGGGNQVVTITLFQRVLILAAGGHLIQTSGGGGAPQEGAKDVTLALTPEQAETLLFVREQGRIQLVLRPPADTEQVSLPPATSATVAELLNLGAQRPAGRNIEIFRGLKKEVVVVPEK